MIRYMLMTDSMRTPVLTSVGQVVERIDVQIDGVKIPVIPVSVAAQRMGYTERHTRLLCDMGKLIAIKIASVWFVSEHDVYNGIQKRLDNRQRANK